MSSRQLEDAMERRIDTKLAAELGLTADELSRVPYEVDSDESDDGVAYSTVIQFLPGGDRQVLAKIADLEDGDLVRLSAGFFEEESGPEDHSEL